VDSSQVIGMRPDTVNDSTIVARYDLRPMVITVAEHDSVQTCAFALLTDGRKMILEQSANVTACRTEFERYLSERSA
jgi:hypothetical protein